MRLGSIRSVGILNGYLLFLSSALLFF